MVHTQLLLPVNHNRLHATQRCHSIICRLRTYHYGTLNGNVPIFR